MKRIVKREKNRRRRILSGTLLLAVCFFTASFTVSAMDTDAVQNVLLENKDLFTSSSIVASALRYLGWAVIRLLIMAASGCADLFDNSFKLIDFTRWEPVQNYIDTWKPVFIALLCLSLLFLGIILIFWHEKKPKFVMNLCLAVLLITSSGYLIDQLNNFISMDMRNAIVDGGNEDGATGDMIYEMVGDSLIDLVYLDDTLDGGLMGVSPDNRTSYDNFTEDDLYLININETIDPDDVQSGSKDLMSHRIYYKYGNMSLEEIPDGVLWTDFLSEYYYRYHVSWFTLALGLLSLIIVYTCLAYKVVRILYEIVIHQLLAVLYSANMSNNQKVLKVLDSVKDSYITLVLVMVCLKIYLLAYKFVNAQGFGAFTKSVMIVFIALAVIDGPNIIQKLTGVDAGLSDGLGKMMSGMYAMNMLRGMMSHFPGSGRLGRGSRSEDTSAPGSKDTLEGKGQGDGVPPDNMQDGADTHIDVGNKKEDSLQNHNEMQDNSQNTPESQTEGYMPEESAGFPEETVNAPGEEGEMSDIEDGTGLSFPEETIKDTLGNDISSLNGLDPVTGDSGIAEKDTDAMERDLAREEGTDRMREFNDAAIEFEGTMFRSEWKESLGKGTSDKSKDSSKTLDKFHLKD